MHEILGQARALDQLQAQLMSGRVHHAQIFHGPPGVGKFTTALAFAKVLLCHQPQHDLAGRAEACGQCVSCLTFRRADDPTLRDDETGGDANPSGGTSPKADTAENSDAGGSATSHPDLRVVNKELARYSDDAAVRNRKLTSIPVDVLRTALIEPAYRGSQLNHGKVFIVDEAELLNAAGQNALLKTLEEPPTPDAGRGTTIILVTSQDNRLLPTIRSRCQRVVFTPLPDDVVARQIEAWDQQLSAAERTWLTGFVLGSLGRLRLSLDYRLTGWAEVVLGQLEKLTRGRAAPTLGADLAERINGFAETWVKRHDNASKEAANKLAASLMFSLIATHARQQLDRLAEACDPADPASAEARLAPWLHVIEALRTAESRLAANVNLGLTCDGLAASLSQSLRQPATPAA